MSSLRSISIYRKLMRVYPADFRRKFGPAMDQAFRDMHCDAFAKRGIIGIALLWFHVVPDFLFSAVELLTKKAGDFLKWRFRLQWIVACSVGFVFTGLINAFAWESLRALGIWGSALSVVILMAGVGLMQSRVLAGRCFRKKQWVLYGVVATAVATVILQPLWISTAVPGQMQLMRVVDQMWGFRFIDQLTGLGSLLRSLIKNVIASIQLLIVGATVGLAQSAAIRKDAITTSRWMIACAIGYFVSQAVGDTAAMYAGSLAAGLLVRSFVKGAVLGLITAGPLEQILFNVQADQPNV